MNQPTVRRLCKKHNRNTSTNTYENTQIQMKIYKYTNSNTTNHFDVGRLRKSARDADEEGGEDEQGGQVHRHNRLKEEPGENQNWL